MADHISKLIGETPLVLLDALSQETGLRVLAKYEAANPGASIKDIAPTIADLLGAKPAREWEGHSLLKH